MSGDASAADNPFSVRTALLLVVFGGIVFVALLWMIGAGLASGPTNDGGSHVGGRGLNGYAAMADYLERRGLSIRRSRSEGALDDAGLLVLTPPAHADGEEIERIVSRRRYAGPTLIVTPKWLAAPANPRDPEAEKGWVTLAGAMPPRWQGFLDDVTVAVEPMRDGRWRGAGLAGRVPQPKLVLSGMGPRLVPLVAGTDGRILAGYIDDAGFYPELDAMALQSPYNGGQDERIHPIVLVFEPDLIDNYGMSSIENARLAEALVRAAAGEDGVEVVFDQTLNGHGRSANLLTLAFTPPFLAATICLLLAAIAVGWRAFMRFGPPRIPERAIGFGKRALVGNAAGLLARAKRAHLVADPYAARVRDRIARALALSRGGSDKDVEAAIDRVGERRAPENEAFSTIARRLRAARRPHDMVRAARDLHALERTLTR
ncbi:hypothetical protein GCM10011371_21640 [Novosphingobium marinum]|uniref:DUF4350 domain-containing protein n=1 Tax=Novosphingobium marinum TaxID=1514948 RepID=A0A7Y9XZQ3_9SPHN|nr:DUF4350 domain-containing protein [Novosphingobium marinum]NYH96278.1 hypothetical protein [Novosphingobium marinum]GGC33901.1 hypothetical protein GCM10011371_21640 [Novosphingobium marinum]